MLTPQEQQTLDMMKRSLASKLHWETGNPLGRMALEDLEEDIDKVERNPSASLAKLILNKYNTTYWQRVAQAQKSQLQTKSDAVTQLKALVNKQEKEIATLSTVTPTPPPPFPSKPAPEIIGGSELELRILNQKKTASTSLVIIGIIAFAAFVFATKKKKGNDTKQ